MAGAADRLPPADSGRKSAPVIYRAAPGEEPVLSGGKLVTGWKPAGDGLWVADVEQDIQFNQLFVNGERRSRARTPNTGYLRIYGPIVNKVSDELRSKILHRSQ